MVLGIYGAGALGREALEIAIDVNDKESRWEKYYYIVDREYQEEKSKDGIEIIVPEDFVKLEREKEAIVAVGTPSERSLMRKKLGRFKIDLARAVIHPSSRIIRDTVLAPGCIVAYGCSISFGNQIGENVYFQPASGVGHNVNIGDDCVVSGGVRIAGYTDVGEMTYIGMNASVRDRVRIGKNCIVSMGSIVQRDIPDGMIAMGNPARVIQRNTGNKIFNK